MSSSSKTCSICFLLLINPLPIFQDVTLQSMSFFMHFEPCSSVLFSLVNLLLQCEQSNGFFSLCTPSCSFSSLFRSKLSWQCGQLNGFFPVCSLSCFIKSLSRLNPLSQFEQLNGLSPNVLSHWVKLNASISACLFS